MRSAAAPLRISAKAPFLLRKKPREHNPVSRRQGRQFRKGRPSACARKAKARPHNLRGRADTCNGRGYKPPLPTSVCARISPCAQHRGGGVWRPQGPPNERQGRAAPRPCLCVRSAHPPPPAGPSPAFLFPSAKAGRTGFRPAAGKAPPSGIRPRSREEGKNPAP